MKFFLKKMALFILIPVALFFISILLPHYPGITNSYFFARLDKDAALKNTVSPRLIFVGGSSVALGLNSQAVKDSLHLNPVNTGLSYNIGLSYMVENTLRYVKSGDIVVIASEYETYFGNLMYGGYPSLWIELEVSPGNISRLSINQWLTLIKVSPEYPRAKLKLWKYFKGPDIPEDSIYLRSSFNRFGDHIGHWKLKTKKPVAENRYEVKLNKDVIKVLLDFQQSLKKKGATLYITFPPYQSSSYANNSMEIKQVEKELHDASFSILGSPDRYRMPDSLMFDSPYHLVKEGVDRRTALLIADLKNAIKGKERHG